MTTIDSTADVAMRNIESPASNDVLCGKDKTFNRNIGNMIYRQLIISTATRYARIKTKPEKMKITASIVHTMIHQHNSRFLKQVMIHEDGNDEDKSSEYYWQEISTTAARDKTSHALRFCASQMRLHRHQEPQHGTTDTTMNRDEATTMAPVTPPIERRSILGRVQRKSNRYSPSQNEAKPSVTTTAAKRNPIHHRRTVSSENATQPNSAIPNASSIDPNEYYSPHPHSFYRNNQQYYYPYHENNHFVHYANESPVPMECSSASLPMYLDSHQSTDTRRSYDTTPHKNLHYGTTASNFVKYHHLSPAKTPTGFVPTTERCNEVDDDDDLDAILREPIHWDDDNVEENDEDGGSNDAFEL